MLESPISNSTGWWDVGLSLEYTLYISVTRLGIRMRIFASRQCADYAGAGEARVARVTFAVGKASCLVFVVSKPRWPRCVRDLSESSVSECVRLCEAHMAYT